MTASSTPPPDLTKCEICGNAATHVVATDKGNVAFCVTHFQLIWNVIPMALAKWVYNISFPNPK